MRSSRPQRRPRRRAFTLVELLVVIGIIGVLVSVLMPALGGARRQARAVRELAALKQVMAAYHLYASENRGSVLPGYHNGGPVTNGRGGAVTFPSCARYPWRLAPNLNYDVAGTLLVNEQEERIGREYSESPGFEYMVSLYPSFGINAAFVGGNRTGGLLMITPAMQRLYGRYVVLKLTDTKRPADLIVFASSRARDGHGPQEGNHMVEPPYTTARRWAAEYREADAPEDFGFVHPRHKLRAAVAMLDGHAELFTVDQLQDMRHWSPQATRPDWTLGSE